MHNCFKGHRLCTHPTAANGRIARAHDAASQQLKSVKDFEWDLSGVHAFRARQDFVKSIRHGEASADLAKAAIAAAAEDDAIGVSSTQTLHKLPYPPLLPTPPWCMNRILEIY
jgi:hypothetical protein